MRRLLLAAIIAILLTACSGVEIPRPDFEGASAYYTHSDDGPGSIGATVNAGAWVISGAWAASDGMAKICLVTPWFAQVCGAVPITTPPPVTQGTK